MKSIVEEIFYGNLRPNDDINKFAEKEVQEMLGAEKKLMEVLSEEQRVLYEELSIQQSICGGLANCGTVCRKRSDTVSAREN